MRSWFGRVLGLTSDTYLSGLAHAFDAIFPSRPLLACTLGLAREQASKSQTVVHCRVSLLLTVRSSARVKKGTASCFCLNESPHLAYYSFPHIMGSPAPCFPPDLSSCSPQELSSWLLLSGRFDGDEMAVTTFLLETVSTLPNARAISDQLVRESSAPSAIVPPSCSSLLSSPASSNNGAKEEEEEGASAPVGGELGARIHPDTGPVGASMSNPRGRFDVEWYENGMAFAEAKDPTSRIAVARGTVRHLVVFSKPEDLLRSKHRNLSGRAKKDSAASAGTKSMMLLVFQHDSECIYKRKRIQQVCLQLPGEVGDEASFVDCVIERLGLDGPSQVVRVQGDRTFRSHSEAGTSTTTSGMPFVNCYHGVNDGVVFPLSRGLLFVKPPLFVPVESIHSVAVGSRNSSGGRYVDLQVAVRAAGADDDDDETTSIEFTNIHKDEAPGLNRYIQSLVNARGDGHNVGDSDSQATADVEAEIHSTNDDDDESSHTLDVSLAKRRNSRPPPRRAGVAARATFRDQPTSTANSDDDQEEEDADFVATGKAHDSSDEEECDTDDDDGDGSEQGSHDEQGGSSSNDDGEATDDEATESESEDTVHATENSAAEKPRKRPRRI
jgi:Histone chaperone Rttp106-like